MKVRLTKLIGLGVALGVGLSTNAQAAFKVEILDGVGSPDSFIIEDNGSNDVISDVGAIGFLGSASGWVFEIVGTTSKPLLGSETNPYMHWNLAATGTGTITFKVTDTDFTGPLGDITLLSDTGGSGTGTGNFDLYLDNTNAEFGTGTLLGSAGYSELNAYDVTTTGPAFSITGVATFTHDTFGSSSVDWTVKVPEPATLALLGAGLIGIGFAGRRRNKKA